MKAKDLQKEKFINSMFNIKISCLMKKQFSYLMMLLAMVILAGTSAMAAPGDNGEPLFQLAGSTHTFNITAENGANDILWSIAPAGGTSSESGEDTDAFLVTWDIDAVGVYTIQVIEENSTGCTTTRQFFVSILTFDARVQLSTDNGGLTELANGVITCGDNHAAPEYVFDNTGITPNVAGAVGGNLTTAIGDLNTTKYVTVSVTFPAEIPAASVGYGSVLFDLTINETNSGQAVTLNGAAIGATAYFAGTTATWALEFNDRWGAANDNAYSVEIHNVQLVTGADGTGTVLGLERSDRDIAYPDAGGFLQNESSTATIVAAPATSVISTP